MEFLDELPNEPIDPERLPDMARAAVIKAIKEGKLTKPDRCSICKTKTKIYAHHHNGYERKFWLDIEWVCQSCHNGLPHTKPPNNPKGETVTKKRKVCPALGCRKSAIIRGVCRTHYTRWYKLDDKGTGPLSRIEVISNPPKKQEPYQREIIPDGTRRIHSNGFVYIKVSPDHMLARNDRPNGTWVLENRKVMAEKLGRPLGRHEKVLHKDGDKTNNSPDNLYITGRGGDAEAS